MAKFLVYDVTGSSMAGVGLHPREDMERIGIKVLHGVPQSILDSWWFYVEDYDCKLPSYIRPKLYPYNLKYWRDNCWKNCEYFQKYHETQNDKYCCWGGNKCFTENSNVLKEGVINDGIPRYLHKIL